MQHSLYQIKWLYLKSYRLFCWGKSDEIIACNIQCIVICLQNKSSQNYIFLNKKRIGILMAAVSSFFFSKFPLMPRLCWRCVLRFLLYLYCKCSSDISLFSVAFSGYICDAFVFGSLRIQQCQKFQNCFQPPGESLSLYHMRTTAASA